MKNKIVILAASFLVAFLLVVQIPFAIFANLFAMLAFFMSEMSDGVASAYYGLLNSVDKYLEKNHG